MLKNCFLVEVTLRLSLFQHSTFQHSLVQSCDIVWMKELFLATFQILVNQEAELF